MDNLTSLSVSEVAPLLRDQKVSAVDVTRATLDRIERLNGTVHAFIKVMPDALEQAQRADAEIATGNYRGPLHGVTFAVKDQFDAAGAPSLTRGRSEADFDRDATVIARLKEAGAIFLGKVTMSSLHPQVHPDARPQRPPEFPQPRNPWNLDRLPGGSSSGSAVAVAAGLCSFALGEDTAGSIRGPAANCGLVGMIGTYGRVSRHGLCEMSWTQDHPGPLTRTALDVALVLRAMAGADPLDQTTSRQPVPDYAAGIEEDTAGAVIGVPRNFIASDELGVQPDVLAAFEDALRVLERAGARIEEIDMPNFELCTLVSFVIYATEFFAANMHDLNEFHEVSPLYRVARGALGALTPAADYLRAQRLRVQYQADVAVLLDRVDFIATPTQTRTAGLIGTPDDGIGGLVRQMKPDFWSIWNLVGLPALTVPCGFDSDGLPIGMQLGGRAFREGDLLRVAHTYQTLTDWHTRRPLLPQS